jgi:hypothetical protein
VFSLQILLFVLQAAMFPIERAPGISHGLPLTSPAAPAR